MRSQAFEQRVQRHVTDHLHVLLMQRVERKQRCASQLRVVIQYAANARQTAAVTTQVQTVQRLFQPRRLQVQHAIGETLRTRRIAVMDVARFEHEDLTWRAVMPGSAAVEALYALLGEADQVGFVPVRIVRVRVPGEMRVQGFDAGVAVVAEVDPVAHGLHTVMGCTQ